MTQSGDNLYESIEDGGKMSLKRGILTKVPVSSQTMIMKSRKWHQSIV